MSDDCCGCPDHSRHIGRVLTQEDLDRRRERVLRFRFDDDERPPGLPACAFVLAGTATFALALAAAIGGAP